MTLPRLECAWDMPIEAAEHLVACIRFDFRIKHQHGSVPEQE